MPDPIDKQAHTQATNDPHPTHRQPTPNKNVKNEKNEKKGSPSRFLSFEEMDIQRAREANARAGERFLAE
ncbi:MAG: hypothetical protein DRP56_04150 [Planctomycetota bacterium]|nr:MAG: hypothetical protein DRP56_04150 [Planctomycetota bacterium]